MTDINPQPELKPEPNTDRLGFTRQHFTSLLIGAGILSPREVVVWWGGLDRDFLAFDIKEKP